MLDLPTLFFSSTVSRAAFLVIFVVTVLGQPRARYLYHWTFALLASASGALLSIIFHRDALLPLPAALVIYPLFLASLATSWSGLRLFYGRAVRVRLVLLLTVLPSVLYASAAAAGVADRITLPFIYLSAALPAAMVLHEILRTPERRLLSQYVIALAFGGYFLALVVPAFLMLFGVMPADNNKTSWVPMIFDQVCGILVYFGYIAMAGERANIDLKQQAETDPLTNLANRRGGVKVLKQLYASRGSGARYSVLLIDIDFFKRINDSLGHDAGDMVLIAIAAKLKADLRKHDHAVRWGGEEFLIILSDTGIAEAELSAERLRSQFEAEPVTIGRQRLTITFSVGVADIEPADLSFEAAILRADQALYRAKRKGRNRVSRSGASSE